MKKVIYFFLVFTIGFLLLITPLIIYFKPSRIIEVTIAGFLAIIISLSLLYYFINKNKSGKLFATIPIIYLMIVFFIGIFIFIKNRNTNLPEPVSYFNVNKILGKNDAFNDNPYLLNLEIIQNHFQNRSEMPISTLFYGRTKVSAIQIKTKADSLFESYYQFMTYPAKKLSQNLDWTENPYNDPHWNFDLNRMSYLVYLTRMSYLVYLTDAYKQFNNISYLKRAEYLILDWISDNSSYLVNPPSKYSWGDHTTALRLINWLYFWEIWTKSPLFTEEKMGTIISSLIAHTERLADPDFYTYNHNHGIDQDIALLSMTLIFPEINKSPEWRKLAFNRIKNQINFAVSSNGIHLEHSPGYHFYGLKQIINLNNLINSWKLKDDLDLNLDHLVYNMVNFIKFIVQPSGQVVPVGDTNIESINKYSEYLRPFLNMDKGLDYIITNGSLGSLSDTAIAFPDEGYVIIRDFNNRKLSFKKSLYLFFTSAAHKKRGHKHFDDLSFTLSYGGYDLLMDPGYYSYKRDEFRSYILSTKAHNTITVDGINFNKFNLPKSVTMLSPSENWDTTFEDFQTDSIFTIIQASHRNYFGLQFRRKLIYIKPNIIIISDEINPDLTGNSDMKNHKFEQFFHTDSEIIAKIVTPMEVQLIISKTGKQAMRILQLGSEEINIKIIRGSKNPIQGWLTESDGKLKAADVVGFEQNGTSTSFITAIELNQSLALENIENFKWSDISYDSNKKLINIKMKNKDFILDINNLKILTFIDK